MFFLTDFFDSQDNIYISDKENKMIQKSDQEGNFLMQIPRAGSDTPVFNAPGDIAVDHLGNIYVADWTSKHIEGTENPRLYVYGPCIHKLNVAGILTQTYFIDEVSAKPGTVAGRFDRKDTTESFW